MDLQESLEQVESPETFLAFVRELIADREKEAGQPVDVFGRGVNGWENHTIETYLEAALAWAEDSNFGKTQDFKDKSPWKLFATFLYCGKIYE